MVRIYDYTGNQAVSIEQGKKVYHILKEKIIHQYKVVVSFENVQYTDKTFLEESFGKIYQHFDSDYLKKHLIITNIQKNAEEELLSVIKDKSKKIAI